MLQVQVREVRQYLDAIGQALASGEPVRVINSDGVNLMPDGLPDDVADMIASAKMSYASRAAASEQHE